jgi:hypothetical protein
MLLAHGIDRILGAGTETNPYQIRTPAQLAEMRDNVNANTGNFQTAHYVQVSDIDLNAIDNWTPIGTDANRFGGVYNGNGYTVYNCKCQSVAFGFFGRVTGTIKNLRIKGGLFTSTNSVTVGGVFCNRLIGGTISGCISDSTIETPLLAEVAYAIISGIAGSIQFENGTISDCINYTSVLLNGASTDSRNFASGIARQGAGVAATILRCLNVGSVQCTTTIGSADAISENATTITNCYFDNQTSIATNAIATGRTTENCQGPDTLTNENKLPNLGTEWIATAGYPSPKRYITRKG